LTNAIAFYWIGRCGREAQEGGGVSRNLRGKETMLLWLAGWDRKTHGSARVGTRLIEQLGYLWELDVRWGGFTGVGGDAVGRVKHELCYRGTGRGLSSWGLGRGERGTGG